MGALSGFSEGLPHPGLPLWRLISSARASAPLPRAVVGKPAGLARCRSPERGYGSALLGPADPGLHPRASGLPLDLVTAPLATVAKRSLLSKTAGAGASGGRQAPMWLRAGDPSSRPRRLSTGRILARATLPVRSTARGDPPGCRQSHRRCNWRTHAPEPALRCPDPPGWTVHINHSLLQFAAATTAAFMLVLGAARFRRVAPPVAMAPMTVAAPRPRPGSDGHRARPASLAGG